MNNPEIDKDGNEFWYNDEGLLYREDGPARKWANGNKSWWINGKRHREDGPAVKFNNGDKKILKDIYVL